RLDLDQVPVVQLTLSAGENSDVADLRDLAQSRFVPALSSAGGVNRVEVIGGADDELPIRLDPEALAETGISTDQISQVLQGNNVSIPAGSLTTNGTTLPVRVDSETNSLDEIRNLLVGSVANVPVTLGDIADVDVVPAESSGVARTNGQPSVALGVYMSQGANTVDTAANVRDELDGVTTQLAQNGTDVEVTTLLDQ